MYSFRHFVISVLLALACINILSIRAACPNDCNRHGVCKNTGLCECDTGYEGNDCGRRQCPMGYSLGAVPYANEATHRLVQCSERGTCDVTTGNCKCDPGFSGRACQTMGCINGCSGHGSCMNLKEAAEFNDGYMYNRTTTYSLWDKETFTGCVCEPGYGGYDCSQKQCRSGLDPRETSISYETATLVCTCTSTCQKGRFKLKYKGVPAGKWLTGASRGIDVADSLLKNMQGVGFSANNSILARHPPVQAYYVDGLAYDYHKAICADSATRKTVIKFNKDLGELPALSFYGNQFSGGSIYFETTQTLTCDCTSPYFCKGSVRLLFDGQASSKLNIESATETDLITALTGMATFSSLGVTVTGGAPSTALCAQGASRTHTFTMTAQMGNIPNLGFFGSYASTLQNSVTTLKYRTNVTSGNSFITFASTNGNTNTVKECNGVGTCKNGQCLCGPGWGSDPNLGPCGALITNTSIHGGLGRCPGVMDLSDPTTDASEKSNYRRIYISINPDPAIWDSRRRGNRFLPSDIKSTIEYYDWQGDVPDMLEEVGRNVLCQMNTNRSAGPMVLDNANDRIIYFDWNGLDYTAATSFLGSVKVSGVNKGVKTNFITGLAYRIFGIAIDPDLRRRKIYWTSPGSYMDLRTGDGGVYWSYLDSNVAANQLSVGTTINPMGIAVHTKMNRLFWVDRVVATKKNWLYSCKIPNTDITDDTDVTSDSQCAAYQVIETVEGRQVSKNITDIVIDYYSNNTLFFIDSGTTPSIMGINLDKPLYNNASYQRDQFSMMYEAHIVVDSKRTPMIDPRYLTIDSRNEVILWSDVKLKRVYFDRYVNYSFDPFVPGVGYTGNYLGDLTQYDGRFSEGVIADPYVPVGLLYDPGLGTPLWGPVVDCFGHGRCLGAAGAWKCECDTGYMDNCNVKVCPSGRAWFHEPVSDNKAHDVLMECSNMGSCDRSLGMCACRTGFEGPACERMSCTGKTNGAAFCGGSGKCMSLNELASHTSYSYGSTPNVPATWDSMSIQGCLPDVYGYLKDVENSQYSRPVASSARSNQDRYSKDSTQVSYIASPDGDSLRSIPCPTGYRLRDKDVFGAKFAANNSFYHGYQKLQCQANGGSFAIKFRDFTSELILYSDTHTMVQKKLESLQTIGRVAVLKTSGSSASTICASSTASADIYLLSQVGPVPPLSIVSNTLTSGSSVVSTISVMRINVGIARECSGNGLCDFSTGLCKCFEGFGPSDGYGNHGDHGDCGFNTIE